MGAATTMQRTTMVMQYDGHPRGDDVSSQAYCPVDGMLDYNNRGFILLNDICDYGVRGEVWETPAIVANRSLEILQLERKSRTRTSPFDCLSF